MLYYRLNYLKHTLIISSNQITISHKVWELDKSVAQGKRVSFHTNSWNKNTGLLVFG